MPYPAAFPVIEASIRLARFWICSFEKMLVCVPATGRTLTQPCG